MTMPPRSLSERSPVSVTQWDDTSTICTSEAKPQTTANIPLAKSVRFTETLHTATFIPHLDDIPDEEVEATWYSAKEYSDIKQLYQKTITMMEAGEKISGDEHTARGLEYRTQEGAWARYENKRDAYNAVLDEQDRQWKVDKDDFDKLREIYLQHSTKCAQAAVVRALQDERDIKEYMVDADALLKPKKKKKKKIIVVKKKKKAASASSGDSVASGSCDSDGNATDTSSKSNRSNRSTKSVTKKKAKQITKKLKRRASGSNRASIILGERNSVVVHDDKSQRAGKVSSS